jgi:hypothetical protein
MRFSDFEAEFFGSVSVLTKIGNRRCGKAAARP